MTGLQTEHRTDEVAAFVQRFVDEVLNGGRPESAPDLVASAPLRARVASLRAAFADLRARVVQVAVDGELVAIHLVASGTHTGRYQGARPTGRAWSSTGTAIYRVCDGRIVDFWMTWDTLDILEQLGIVRRSPDASA